MAGPAVEESLAAVTSPRVSPDQDITCCHEVADAIVTDRQTRGGMAPSGTDRLRAEKTARNYDAALCLAASFHWLTAISGG